MISSEVETQAVQDIRKLRRSEAYVEGFRKYLLTGETRTLVAGQDAKGGYLVPAQVAKAVITGLDEMLPIRRRATKYTLSGGVQVGIPTISDDLSDSGWTSETPTSQTADDIRFGLANLRPHPLTKMVEVSRRLLRQATIDINALVGGLIARRMRGPMEAAYINGSGVGMPLGVFPTSDCLPSTRNVTAAAAGTIAIGDLHAMEEKLSAQYLESPSCAWLMHPTVWKAVRGLQAANPGAFERAGTERRYLLGYPVMLSSRCPSSIAANQPTVILADWSAYTIVDDGDIEVVVSSVGLEQGLSTFFAFAASDGQPTDPNGFARLVQAAA